MDFWTRRIEPAEAKRRLDQGRALILDVTRKPHPVMIRGAVRPARRDLPGWLAAVQEGKDVITYCT
ncbi:MAG: rhodanese-like domain-containing protein [Candidatus Binataceae bacterium]